MKKSLIILFLIITNLIQAQKQKPYTFGEVPQDEYNITIYSKDSTANALFLFERGETKFYQTSNEIVIRTKYYARVKIFNKEGLDHATIKIPIYHNSKRSEKVIDVRGITHNGTEKVKLSKKHIYKEKISDRWSEVKFTMPDIKDNSIIEYEYAIVSPFKFNFKGWKFQTDIPKIYSEFYALIPGNYKYNRKLTGYYNLTTNDSKIKRDCFEVSGYGKADCEELTYIMKNIPAFIEEDYLTSKKNFLSTIKFELSEFKWFDGSNHKYSKTWKDTDREFKTEKSIGKQLRKIDYIKKNLPIDLISDDQSLDHAKKVYNYIKSHFTWNNKYRVFNDVNVKQAFNEKVGNSMEINIALINALNAAGFDAEIMLISTRKNGLPTKLYPVMTDFNYALAKLNIGDQSYLLDANNKQMPFAMLPFKTLNGYGRVMNFKKGSYWYTIKSQHKSQVRTSLNLKLNESGNLEGLMNTSNSGYLGLMKREKYTKVDEDEYLGAIEDKNQDLSILSYKNDNLYDIEKSFSETFSIEIESDLNKNTLLVNPFLLNRVNENPFKLKERNYPVDFGYHYLNTFTLQLEIPKGYIVKSLPEAVAFKLPNNAGAYYFKTVHKDQKISLVSRIKLSKSYFTPEEYPYLKEFYNQIIKTQKSLITLEKNNL